MMRPERKTGIVAVAALTWLLAVPGVARAGGEDPKPRSSHMFRSDTGVDVHVGLAASLVRVRSTRLATSFGRERRYEIDASPLATQYGFQISIAPSAVPFAAPNLLDGGARFQFVSVTILGLVTIPTDGQPADQVEVSLGLGFAFFEHAIGLAVTFDLYRGVPIRGPVGPGETAFTGLFGWAFAPEGEITPENVAFVLTLDLTAVAAALDIR